MSKRKVKCPYCDYRNTRDKVIDHVDSAHEELIPEGYSAARVVFNYINHKDYGICIVCKRKTEWNEKTQKYNRLCNKLDCKRKLRDAYKKNMMSKYGKTTLLDDPTQQQKMLFNRKISGIYKFSNNKIMHYTGSYEKKFIEFMDKVLHMTPDDFIMPGPTVEYEYDGKKRFWILDAYLIEYNCAIDIKDGGDNPNNRSMPEYRAKQIAKEKALAKSGSYNYIRLTNNDFSQLLEFMYEYKNQLKDDSEENRKAIIKINESYDSIESKCSTAIDEVCNRIDSIQESYKIVKSGVNGKISALKDRNIKAVNRLMKLSYDKSSDENIKYGIFDDEPKMVYRIFPFYNEKVFWSTVNKQYMSMDPALIIAFCRCMAFCKCPIKLTDDTIYLSKEWVRANSFRKFYYIETDKFYYSGSNESYYISNIGNYDYNFIVISLEKLLMIINNLGYPKLIIK